MADWKEDLKEIQAEFKYSEGMIHKVFEGADVGLFAQVFLRQRLIYRLLMIILERLSGKI